MSLWIRSPISVCIHRENNNNKQSPRIKTQEEHSSHLISKNLFQFQIGFQISFQTFVLQNIHFRKCIIEYEVTVYTT